MKPSAFAALAVFCLAACGEEELKSGPTCPEGQHQVCRGDEDKLRCICVSEGADGSAPDAGPADATAE